MAKARIVARALYAGMLAAKRCRLTERPANPYKPGKYRDAFERGVDRYRESGTMKVTASRRV